MRFQAFVPDWPGEKQHGKATARILEKFCEVQILDNPKHFFSEQWEAARSKFDADVFLWVMADVWPPIDDEAWFNALVRLFERGVGVCEPQTFWNGWQYPLNKLVAFEPNVYLVPGTEMLIVGIHREVLRRMPRVDYRINWIGTGVDRCFDAASQLIGMPVVRDYRFLAAHPEGTGYPKETAWDDMARWLEQVRKTDPQIVAKVYELFEESRRLVLTGDVLQSFKLTPAQLAAWTR